MTPAAILFTASLMGLFVLAGGAYGSLYSIGRLRGQPVLVRFSGFCYAATLLCALAIAALTPLDFGWKLLILGSAAVYAIIPPMTWRYLQRLHAEEELEQ